MRDAEKRVLHELEVHREELAILNDALRQARLDLEASRNRYAELYDLAPVGHVDFDARGVILTINSTGASLLGVPRERLEGLPFTTFVDPADMMEYFGHLRRCLMEKGRIDTQITLRPRGFSGNCPIRAHLASIAVRQNPGTVIRSAFINLPAVEEEEERQTKRANQLNEFSLIALSRLDFPEIARAAALLVARILGAGFAEILEYRSGAHDLQTIATAGRRTLAARQNVPAADSPYQEVLRTRNPVILEDRPADIASRAAHLAQAQIASGVAVLVPAEPANPYGVLGAYSAVRRSYAPGDVVFLQSVANALGVAASNRRMESALKESESRFRLLVEHSPVGVFIVRGGRIVYRNPEQDRLFGAVPEGFELRAFRDVHPEDARKFAELCAAVSGKGEAAHEVDLRFYPYGKSSEGTDLRWVHVHTLPMAYGGEPAVVVSMTDITRLKEMEYQFLVREKMASLGHVAAGIAHEIRNPLSGINIHLAALERIHDDAAALGEEERAQAEGIVRQIQSASDRIESVIRKVMDFSRPSAVRTDAADINQAIENAIDFTATQLRRERILLDRSQLGVLPKCPADPPMITQVVMNLIVNAAQAMERADGSKVIGISSVVDGGRIVICISDSGPGIPPGMRERIFDPFYTTRPDGYGIGLSFCRRVISEHGGRMNVAASPLGGAEFRIELPIRSREARG